MRVLVLVLILAAQDGDRGKAAKDDAVDFAQEIVFESLKAAGVPGIEVVDAMEDLVFDPLKAFLETKDETCLQKAFERLLFGMVDVALPTYGLIIKGGKVSISGGVYATEELYKAGRKQQFDALLFGSNSENVLGSINNLYRQVPFFTVGAVTNRKITPENIHEKVKTEEELKKLYFEYYYNTLCDVLLAKSDESKADVMKTLREAWPQLQDYWKKKRTALEEVEKMEKMRADFIRRGQEVLKNLEERRKGMADEIVKKGDDYVVFLVEKTYIHIYKRKHYKMPIPKKMVIGAGNGDDPAATELLLPAEGTPAAQCFLTRPDAYKAFVSELTDIEYTWEPRARPKEAIVATYQGRKVWLRLEPYPRRTYDMASQIGALRSVDNAIVPLKKFGKQYLVKATKCARITPDKKELLWVMIRENQLNLGQKLTTLSDEQGNRTQYDLTDIRGPFSTNYELAPVLREIAKTEKELYNIYLAAEDRFVSIDDIPEGVTPRNSGKKR